MSLTITRLNVRDFRCYEEYSLEPAPDLTVIVGPNAVGKTTLIEAIQLLTAGESFRRPQWSELVRWGADEAHISIEAQGSGRSLETEMRVVGGRREYCVNGKQRRRVADVAGRLPCVVFSPEDLRVTKESAEKRRNALDSLGVQLSGSYLKLKNEYEKILRQRNALLKDEQASGAELDVWTERLLEVGEGLEQARGKLFARLKPALQRSHEAITGIQNLVVTYAPSWTRDGIGDTGSIGSNLRAQLDSKRREEAARGTTLVGPHRDDIEFEIGGHDARAFASQGQHRTIALSWKLAEVAVIEEVSGEKPVLLLDDVMSELDEERRHALASKAGNLAQTIMTTTNAGYFEPELMARAKVVELS